KEEAKKYNLSVREATVSNVNDIQQAAQSLVGKVDLIYTPTDNTIASAVPALIKITE
ncbi:MAG TPA: ABC transporter substrate-binding protein, partial [Sutterellaceae bacterium]|nr:ABC transporter substrate-binding protein [Sutterellaceae bacterium]